ncbi:MAG: HD domain-containing phosphohydrolase [Oligoflexia bacterium]|nr:HD domain-containing phosphohydrolase [Oligoflexia bacterium]
MKPGYTEIKIKDLSTRRPLPCDLYFEMVPANRLVKLHQKGDTISPERYRRFRDKNVRRAWIPDQQAEDFKQYRLLLERAPAAEAAQMLFSSLSEPLPHHFEQGLDPNELQNDIQEGWQMAAKAAQWLAFPDGNPASPQAFALWSEAAKQPQPSAQFRVAILTILFAGTVQSFESPLYADLALAALAEKSETLPSRVALWLEQRYERFDGSGHPKALKGFEIDDFAQLLAIADTVDGIFNADPQKTPRGLPAARKALESLNCRPPFPQLFNPDFFSAIISKVFTEAPIRESAQAA